MTGYSDDYDHEYADDATTRPVEIGDLVFVGFNSKVVALDRYNGDVVWSWKSPQGSGFVSVLVDGDRLIVSPQGYTYCLDPLTGEQLWSQPLRGYGVGTACVTSVRGNSLQTSAAAAQIAADQAAQHSASTAHVH